MVSRNKAKPFDYGSMGGRLLPLAVGRQWIFLTREPIFIAKNTLQNKCQIAIPWGPDGAEYNFACLSRDCKRVRKQTKAAVRAH